MQRELFGRNNNPCGYDTHLSLYYLVNDLVHLPNSTISTLGSTLIKSNKQCLWAPTGSITWRTNRQSTKNISCTINSLHHQQQALTTLSSPKQFAPQQFIKQKQMQKIKSDLCESSLNTTNESTTNTIKSMFQQPLVNHIMHQCSFKPNQHKATQNHR